MVSPYRHNPPPLGDTEYKRNGVVDDDLRTEAGRRDVLLIMQRRTKSILLTPCGNR